MGLTLKTTQDIWFSQTDTADATNKVVISANTELSIDSCSVMGEALQLTLSTPLNGLSQGFIQASGIVSVSVLAVPTPPKKQLELGVSPRPQGDDPEPEKS